MHLTWTLGGSFPLSKLFVTWSFVRCLVTPNLDWLSKLVIFQMLPGYQQKFGGRFLLLPALPVLRKKACLCRE